MEILSDIKQTFKEGSALVRLIYINLAVFLVLKILAVIFFLSNQTVSPADWLSVPSDPAFLVKRPWTLLTYMFTHAGFIHILFNLLGLYWFGKLFLYRLENTKLVAVYFFGGLCGAVFYFIAYNIFPVFAGTNGLLLGASASVFAVLVAIAAYTPNEEITLSFIGTFRLKYIAIFYVLLSVTGISLSNPGGNIAHLGGAAWGWFYISQLNRGRSIGEGLIGIASQVATALNGLFKPKSNLKVTFKKPPKDDHEYNRVKNKEHEEINRILEKISRTGYDSLTASEKDLLFRQGKN